MAVACPRLPWACAKYEAGGMATRASVFGGWHLTFSEDINQHQRHHFVLTCNQFHVTPTRHVVNAGGKSSSGLEQCLFYRLDPLVFLRVVDAESGAELPVGEAHLAFQGLLGDKAVQRARESMSALL